jgi:hypothetical protein
MSDHIAGLVSRSDLRELADARIRSIALELDLHPDLDFTRYLPPGPVAQRFLNSTALTAVLMGPLGGGKTTACAFKRILAATLAPIARHPEDGIPTRMCRWVVLRDTFRSAEKTVLESWKQWFPKNYAGSSAQGGNDRPYVHTLRFLGMDGVRVEAITEFAGLGENSIETLMKGREYSGAWLNELDTHAEGALDDMEQRTGRYPKADILLTRREIAALEEKLGRKLFAPERRMRTVIGDMNAPTVDNWTYDTLVSDLGPGREFFQQPSGRSNAAENLFNLEPDYYDRIIENQEERFVMRMVDNKFGYSLAGKAVYQNFDHRRHVSEQPLRYYPDRDLHIGADVSTGGLSPAALLGQENVRINVLAELWMGQGVGPTRFGEALQRLMNERFPNHPRKQIRLWPDPAAFGGEDKETDQKHAADIIAAALGVVAQLPGNGSNDIAMRLKAMENEFRGYFEPGSSLMIDPSCVEYIKACGGKYRFKRKVAGSTNDYEELPEKAHPSSDIADAGQYLVIGIRGAVAVMRGERQNVGQRWSSQANAQPQGPGWGGSNGFDPHRVGTR